MGGPTQPKDSLGPEGAEGIRFRVHSRPATCTSCFCIRLGRMFIKSRKCPALYMGPPQGPVSAWELPQGLFLGTACPVIGQQGGRVRA